MKIHHICLTFFILAISTTFIGCGRNKKPPQQEPAKTATQSETLSKYDNETKSRIVSRVITNKGFYGTAFLVCPDTDENIKLLITAQHVAEQASLDEGFSIEQNGLTLAVRKTIQPYPSVDLSFIMVNNTELLESLPCLRLAKDIPGKEDDIYSYNYSLDGVLFNNAPMLSKGYIVSLGSKGIYAYLTSTDYGSSGAPVILQKDSSVVGMITNKITTNSGEYQGVIYAITYEDISAAYHRLINNNPEWVHNSSKQQ